MNERYTYGYNVGWNVENEYISSLKGILVSYNAQVKIINSINESINETKRTIENDTKITDDQIRGWYNEDYLLNGSLISFEKYKSDVLDAVNKRRDKLSRTIGPKQDEYYANLKYLIDIKNENRKIILKRKKDLN